MENNTQDTQKSFNTNWIYLGIIAILLVAGIYLFVTKNEVEKQKADKDIELATVSTDKATVENQYNAALARLDEMKGQSIQMDSLLNDRNAEVEELKRKIKKILDNKNASESELKKANSMIAQLNNKMAEFQNTITALKQENITLTEEKKQLTTAQENLKEEKRKVEKTLETTIETASILHASDFKMEAINKKKNLLGKDKEIETGKAKKADFIKFSFDLDENRVSESGEKVIYICVYKPNGSIAGNNSKFKLSTGAEKGYTTSKTISYKQGEKVNDIATQWIPSEDFEKGNYKVEVYHMGYNIGSENVTLK
jgi:predicted  nucleic acid-binding Zn-ribbon protein